MVTEKEEAWLNHYMETGDAKGATRAVFDCSEKSLPSRTSQLKTKLAAQIHKKMISSFAVDSVKAAKIVRDLAFSAQSEPVKLKAACDLLDRGGFKPVNEHKELSEDVNPEALNARIAELKQQIISELSPEELEQALIARQGVH